MKKVLFVASVTRHINAFHLPFLEQFKKDGYTVEVASNGELEVPFCDKRHQIEFQRSPLKKDNILAYRRLKRVIAGGGYDIIHCHTPVAAMLTRIAARGMRKKGTKVFYTAHGFHFFKGAPFLNWLIYFPVEWLCSFLTDTLITINREDFAFAKKHLHAKHTGYVHGVGIDIEKFQNITVDRCKKRKELGIPEESIAIVSVGELNDNKNHETVLRAVAKLNREDVVYIICGSGEKKEYLKQLAKQLGVEEKLILAGFRTDIAEVLKCCDIFAFPSKREGLPVSVMEALASGLPCVVSKIRGNCDLVEDGKNGFTCPALDGDTFAIKINELIVSNALRESFKNQALVRIQEFDASRVNHEMMDIYR